MAVYTVELAPEAQCDLENIYRHYIDFAAQHVAVKLLTQLEDAILSLESEPFRGHSPRELQNSVRGYFEILTPSFRLIYRVSNKKVIILMVLHQKQSVQKALTNRLLH